MIRKFDTALRRAIDGSAALLVLIVTSLGILQVISRYFFNTSLVWSEEAIRLLYVWLILIAAATAHHMKITMIEDNLRGGMLVALKLMQTLMMLALLVLLVWGALQLNTAFGRDRYVTLGIGKSWYWTGAIVGGLLWAGSIVSGLAVTISERRDT
ncbi:TRAP transporter small permease [Pseudoruegeria sp. SK021]|uniref:TRAP transporter small permease n=1 Tax=Pseudoruegeria sp. SK021 TaxID=1933035 RepID=UPI000A25C81F|nr:TRAP transporter small permease subunit [Pseudoruegeria sp. SK021]OSP53795.1 hypothetical protein BV911_15915 [Pseudoruegeria sp. SK021]